MNDYFPELFLVWRDVNRRGSITEFEKRLTLAEHRTNCLLSRSTLTERVDSNVANLLFSAGPESIDIKLYRAFSDYRNL